MRKVFNLISGFFIALAPLGLAAVFGIVVYATLPNVAAIIIVVLLGVGAIWLGVSIFKKVQVMGPIAFMTAVRATPDMDKLEPVQSSRTKRRSPQEWVQLVARQENLFKGGSIRIFGDWFGAPYEREHEVVSAEFDPQANRLTLHFRTGEKLEVYHPEHLFEAITFFKIIKASRVRLTWLQASKAESEGRSAYLDYQPEGRKIVTDSSVAGYKPQFDVSPAHPALMIFG